MEKQFFEYEGSDTLEVIDRLGETLEEMPCEIDLVSFENDDEVYHTFMIETYESTYSCVVYSTLSLYLTRECAHVKAMHQAPVMSMSGAEALSIIKVMNDMEDMFLDLGFTVIHDEHHECNHDHHHHHHNCNCH